MTIYTSDGCTYEGMDLITITQMRLNSGRDTIVISKEAYEAIIAQAPVK